MMAPGTASPAGVLHARMRLSVFGTLALFALSACGKAFDRTLANKGMEMFESVCLAPDQVSRRAALAASRLQPLENESTRALFAQSPGEAYGSRGLNTFVLVLRNEIQSCSVAMTAVEPKAVDERLSQLLGNLALRRYSVTQVANTGPGDRPNRVLTLTDVSGTKRIVILRSAQDEKERIQATLAAIEGPLVNMWKSGSFRPPL